MSPAIPGSTRSEGNRDSSPLLGKAEKLHKEASAVFVRLKGDSALGVRVA